MTIIVYKCDTCNREIEKVQNKKGFDFVGRCVITNGCKGNLHKTAEKPAQTVASVTPPSSGLDDWIQRKILYTHTQTLNSTKWIIEHDLKTNPSVQVFAERRVGDDVTLEEIEPLNINIISPNVVEVELDDSYHGTAQCIARSSSEGQTITDTTQEVVSSDEAYQISVDQFITVATLPGVAQQFEIVFISPTSGNTTTVVVEVEPVAGTENWTGVRQVLINGKLYDVYGGELTFAEQASIENGSTAYVQKSTDVQYDEGELLMLLTNPPFESTIDKNLDQYTFVHESTRSNSSISFIWKGNELFGLDGVRTTVFPSIKITA